MGATDMNDFTCLVTGANGGIGKATSRGLAGMGANVVMVCRSAERGEAARQEVADAAENPNVELMVADLSSQGSIRKLARRFSASHARLDLLINNAGVIPERRRLTVDGLETQLAVNHLAPFLLTNLLLDALQAAPAARVVTVSSQVHSKSPIDFDDLQSERGYAPSLVYRKMKLANILFTRELARRLEGTNVTANCLHPGVIATNLFEAYMDSSRSAGVGAQTPSADAPEIGAAAVLRVATSPEAGAVSGAYFAEGRPRDPAPVAMDDERALRLWDVSARLTGL